MGRPGTGLHPLRGQNNVQGASDAGLIPMVFPDYQSVEDPAIRKMYEDFWGTELDPKRGLTVVEIMNAAYDRKIKGMYILGENPAMSDPDLDHVRAAFAKLEHLVVQDIFLTETAWHADVVLPASAHAEKWGTFTNTNRQVQLGRPVIDPPGEVRQDWALIQELARRVGLAWTYTHPREVFAEMAEVMPSLKNITWERLEREDSVTYPCDAPDKPGNEIIFAAGFPTKSGRGKIVPADVTPPARDSRRGIPDGADDGAAARALAHRRDDAARVEPRRARTRADCVSQPMGHEAAGHRGGRDGARGDAARRDRAPLAARPGRAGRHGLHSLLLQRGRRQHPDQPPARSVREDPRVQVLRRAHRAGGRAAGGGIGGRAFRGMLDLLAKGAAEDPALLAPGRAPLSYGALRALVTETIARLNALGIGRNDRVAIVLPNGPEMATAFVAIAAGATTAPLNPAYRAEEFEFYLTDLGAKALVLDADGNAAAEAVAAKLGVPVLRLEMEASGPAGAFATERRGNRRGRALPGPAEASDIALVLHTSGTTSRPKIVPLSHANIAASAKNIRETLALTPGDRCLNIMPLFHIHGLIAAVSASLSAGASVFATPGFNALKFFQWMDEAEPTWYTAVPTMHQAILSRAPRNLDSVARAKLRFIRSSSSSLPPQVMAELEKTFGCPVIEILRNDRGDASDGLEPAAAEAAQGRQRRPRRRAGDGDHGGGRAAARRRARRERSSSAGRT